MSASSQHSAGLRIGFCARSRIESLPIGAPQAIAQVCPSAPRTALSDPISDARNPTSGTGQKVVRFLTASSIIRCWNETGISDLPQKTADL